MTNLYIQGDGRELVRRKGTLRLTAPGIDASAAFDGLHYARVSGTDYLMGVQLGSISEWINGGRGDIVAGGASRFTTGRRVGAAFLPQGTYQALYMGDGLNQNVRWDGTSVKCVQCSQPGSGTTGIGLGSGTLNGVYTYKVTFTSADGNDSEASAQCGNILAINNASISLSNIPTAPASEDCTGRRLWRTIQGGGGFWYLVGTISDNTTTTFSDTTADSSVDTTVAVDDAVVRFPPCQILVGHQLRLCGILCATSEGDTRTLYLSDFEKPWTCTNVGPLDQVDDPTEGARIPLQDTPTGLTVYGNVLIVWFQNQAWRLIGDNPNNWSFDKWLTVGCSAHRTARVYRTSLVWLAADGVYAVEGTGGGIGVNRISDDIRATLDTLTGADFEAAHAFIWFDRYYLCFPTAGKAFYYDFRYRAWGELTQWSWDHAAVRQASATTREQIYAAIHAAGQVWQLETGTDDTGLAIPVRWQSRDKDLGQFGREKRVHRIVCRFKLAAGTVTVNLYRGGGELLQTVTQDISVPTRTGGDISELIARVTEAARDEYFSLEVLHSAFSDDFRLLSAGYMWSLAT